MRISHSVTPLMKSFKQYGWSCHLQDPVTSILVNLHVKHYTQLLRSLTNREAHVEKKTSVDCHKRSILHVEIVSPVVHHKNIRIGIVFGLIWWKTSPIFLWFTWGQRRKRGREGEVALIFSLFHKTRLRKSLHKAFLQFVDVPEFRRSIS